MQKVNHSGSRKGVYKEVIKSDTEGTGYGQTCDVTHPKYFYISVTQFFFFF